MKPISWKPVTPKNAHLGGMNLTCSVGQVGYLRLSRAQSQSDYNHLAYVMARMPAKQLH